MCWNWQVSIGSFSLISLIAYSLYQRGHANDKLLALWLGSYGSMQLFETFQWLGQNPEYEYLNKFGSFFAALLLYLHPLAITVGLSVDSGYKNIINNGTFKLLFYASIAMAVFGLYRVTNAYINKTHTFLSKPDSISKHMVWEFPDDYYISILLILITGIIFIVPKYLWLFIVGLLYYFLPIIIILLTTEVEEKNKIKNYAGSYWCWYVAVFSFLFYFRSS
jgi:hypothetical protein